MIKEFVPLRFVLILMIFFHHATDFAGGGWSAVAYFFVLSGFCMMLGYRDKVMAESFSYVSYIKKRFLRIYPLHWFTLLTAVCLMLWQEQPVRNLKTLVTNFLLLQSWVPDKAVYFSYNPVSWYLSTTLLAVLLFPMLLTFLERLKIRDSAFFGALILFAYSVIAFRMPIDERHAMLYIHPVARIVDFILGMYLARGYLELKKTEAAMNWIKNHGALLDIGFLAGMALFVLVAIVVKEPYKPISGLIWLPIAFSLLCLALGANCTTFLHCMLQAKAVRVLSQCSFSLMMWHIIIIRIVNNMPPVYGEGRIVDMVMKLLLSYVVAQISYYMIEKKSIIIKR